MNVLSAGRRAWLLSEAPASRAQAAWGELPGAQRTLGVVVALALLVGAVAFVQWQRAPQLSPLFTGLSSADGGAVVEELQAAGVAGLRCVTLPQALEPGLRCA